MMTSSVAPGTVPVLQSAVVVQSPLTPPVQVIVAIRRALLPHLPVFAHQRVRVGAVVRGARGRHPHTPGSANLPTTLGRDWLHLGYTLDSVGQAEQCLGVVVQDTVGGPIREFDATDESEGFAVLLVILEHRIIAAGHESV